MHTNTEEAQAGPKGSHGYQVLASGDFMLLTSANDGGLAVLSLLVWSVHRQCKVSILVSAELRRGLAVTVGLPVTQNTGVYWEITKNGSDRLHFKITIKQ